MPIYWTIEIILLLYNVYCVYFYACEFNFLSFLFFQGMIISRSRTQSLYPLRLKNRYSIFALKLSIYIFVTLDCKRDEFDLSFKHGPGQKRLVPTANKLWSLEKSSHYRWSTYTCEYTFIMNSSSLPVFCKIIICSF